MSIFHKYSKAGRSLDWMDGENIRPYIYVRDDNRSRKPGQVFGAKWFPYQTVFKNAFMIDEVHFGNLILDLETAAFGSAGLQMPRWVFFDCAIMPGYISGFCYRADRLPEHIRAVFKNGIKSDWVPLSLFISIPTIAKKEWVAHNLCSINSVLKNKEQQFYGLGFLSKAFGLWHANIETLCGMTQWGGPALKLHAHYGEFEVLTAYTPIHSYARTMAYRVTVDDGYWPLFFAPKEVKGFNQRFENAGFEVDPKDDQSLIAFQRRIERGEGPFYLSSNEVRHKTLEARLTVYRPRKRKKN